ncbi:MAG: acyl-CoA dehydrogenase [Alphaproteobacteria bacterium]|nr:acyl-CoA dehydrogenase [Alphaproteobacteria bacterium]
MTDTKPALGSWVGRERVTTDIIAADRLARLAATLDRGDPDPKPGDPLPPCWHWMFFYESTPLAGVGPDGHPARGGFLPPIDKPRRMWAGSRIRFIDPPRVGEAVQRLSRIASVTEKEGKSGQLVFVTVVHEISTSRGLAISEEQDLVYRDLPAKGAPTPPALSAPSNAIWRRTINPSPVLLFRYSALTYNSHRIHYDLKYCQDIEGYPGLIVHGPLTATLLIDLVRRERPDARVESLDFKGVSPLFDTAPFIVAGRQHEDGKGASLWAEGANGALAMTGDVGFS